MHKLYLGHLNCGLCQHVAGDCNSTRTGRDLLYRSAHWCTQGMLEVGT